MEENNIKCEILSKSACDRYLYESTYISELKVVDAPCFFDGPDDGPDYYCVTQSSLAEGNCTNIKTNSVIISDEGENIESCNNGSVLFKWPFRCLWVWSDSENKHFCSTIYFLMKDGL
jgi:hypothetical protein